MEKIMTIDGEEVLLELDVYISNSISDDLYLFQYPLKPAWRPYDIGLCQEVRIKPQSEVVEMDFSIPISELETANKKEKIEGEEETEHHTVRSSRIPLQTNYAVGVHKGHEIHLTALPKIYQIRPDFSDINAKAEERKKKLAEKEKENKSDEEEEVVLTSIPIRMAQESDRAKYIREHSWEHLKKQEEIEKWTKLKLVDKDDEKSEILFAKLTTQNRDEVNPDLTITQYVNELASPVEPIILDYTYVPEISWTQIRTMPLDKMIRHIMLKVKIIQHKEILELIGNTHESKTVMNYLQESAYIVRGVWIVKSALLPYSPKKIHVRTYILCQFALTEGPLQCRQLSIDVGLPISFIKQIMQEFCVVNKKEHMWELKKEPDLDFIRNHSRLIENYIKTWNSKSVQLFQEATSHHDDPIEIEGEEKGQSLFIGLQSVHSEHEKELIYFLTNLFHQYGVISYSVIKQKLLRAFRANEFKVLTKEHINSQKVIEETLAKICDSMHGGYYLKNFSSNVEQERYRQAIIEIFKDKISIVKKDINTAVKRQTGKNIPENAYSKILREFAYFKQNKWIFKSGNEDETEGGTGEMEIIEDDK